MTDGAKETRDRHFQTSFFGIAVGFEPSSFTLNFIKFEIS